MLIVTYNVPLVLMSGALHVHAVPLRLLAGPEPLDQRRGHQPDTLRVVRCYVLLLLLSFILLIITIIIITIIIIIIAAVSITVIIDHELIIRGGTTCLTPLV